MDDIAGKVVLVTGAARGIGLGLAQAFAAAGAHLALTDIDGVALEEAARSLPLGTLTFGLDVRSPADWSRVVAGIEEVHGGIDILCNNAGVGMGRSAASGPTGFADIPLEHWQLLLDVNLTGVFLGVRSVVPGMIARGRGGHVVNTASMAGFLAPAGLAGYSASKFGVVALSESLAAELLPVGIGVSILCPGGVRSDFVERSAERSALAAGRPFTPPVQPMKMQARNVGERVVQAVRANELHVFTHPEYEPLVRERVDAVMAAFGPSAEPGYSDTPAMLAGSGNAAYRR
ncbi:SDR family oxidoreductase [uncultured Alsobacter sp.]|uniref:SDR family oxidoreductase n=1 Tax=uncultured Alsobacter sp. TaxID=1748258 RepID=UPI0025D4A983|nr:SDR family oxidoreductase [uncultured Alsobacter sp.]